MPLYKRGDIWWFDFTIDGHRYRGSTDLRSKTAAQRVEDRERERVKLGASAAPVYTIRKAADRWFAAKVAGKRSQATTAVRLEIMLRHIGEHVSVADIDSPDIAEAIQRRRLDIIGRNRKSPQGPSNGTVNRDMIDTTLRPILNYARKVLKVRTHDIDWRELRLPESKGRDRTYTTDEIARWKADLPVWYWPLFDFYSRYAPRLREAFFPPEAYDPDDGRVFLRVRKNGRQHSIKLLPEDAADMTARYGRAKAAGLPTVWFRETEEGLVALTPRGYQSASRAALNRAGIADAKPTHDLRHQGATALLKGTGNLAAVKRMLGHENIASTMRYAHADDEDVLDALRHTYGTSEPEKPKRRTKSKGGITT